jgi:tetratricopeptide (TPR) repeat protein
MSRAPTGAALRRWTAGLLACGLLACRAQVADRPVEHPDLGGLEPAVREQLAAAQERLSALSAMPNADPLARGSAYGELGRHYHAYGLDGPAEACYVNAGRLQPREPAWPYYRGHLYLGQQRSAEAREAFERALELQPTDGPTLVALARLHREGSEPEAAEAYARRAVAEDPQSAGALLELAQLAAAREEWGEAISLYRRLLRLQPAATRLYGLLADAHRGAGQEKEARAILSLRGEGTLTMNDPRLAELEELRVDAESYMERGDEAFRRGDWAAAVAAFGRAVEQRSDDLEARVNLGSALFRSGRLEEARAPYLHVLERQPDHPRAHFGLAVLLAEEGDALGSERHYEAALAADPGYRDPRLNLANLLRRQGRFAEAVVHYGELTERDPTDGVAWVGEAATLVHLGRHEEARERLKLGLQANPTSALLAQLGARLLAASPDPAVRDPAQAVDLAMQLVQMRPSYAHLETLAMALAAAGRFDEAIQAQTSAIAGAEREGQSDLVPRLHANLERYRSGQPAADPGIG